MALDGERGEQEEEKKKKKKKKKRKKIMNGGEEAYLERPKTDELYKIYK